MHEELVGPKIKSQRIWVQYIPYLAYILSLNFMPGGVPPEARGPWCWSMGDSLVNTEEVWG